MTTDEVKKLNLPRSPGCYQFLDSKGKIIYIGKAVDLKSRVPSYFQKSANHSPAKSSMLGRVGAIKWTVTDSEVEALLLEANLIKKHQPHYNVMLRDDKRHAYIKVSTEDEIPGVFITRKITKSGKYFGPFVRMEPLRQVLKVIRRIWPYCTLRTARGKPCFFYQIGRCTGVCGGKIDAKEYRKKIIKPIILLLEGKKARIIGSMKKEMQELLRRGSEDEAAKIDWQIKNMEYVIRQAHIIGIADKYAADVDELAKLLPLKKKPRRIEGYDISNIFGKEAVGSMVVFTEGEPDKSEYRKFKIRSAHDFIDDAGMLKQILERRFSHSAINQKSKNNIERWPIPELIIIDGGKAQLNAAVGVIRKYKLDIQAIAISKGSGLRSARAQDKLFFPGEKNPLELPLASPALHLVKRVRDEAHRFAIGYHRVLRNKKWKKR